MAKTTWTGVGVAMQSALATAVTITGITKANPGVATSAGHGLTDGDIVLLDIEGMHQLDEVVVRVNNSAVDTFELEGIDTTGYGTFSSGTAQKITFGTSISSATTVSASGGDFNMEDFTTIHDERKKEEPGQQNAISYQMEHIWDVSNSGQVAMLAASKGKTLKAYRFTFNNGQLMYFAGKVGFTGVPTGSAPGKVSTNAVFTINGDPTYYSS